MTSPATTATSKIDLEAGEGRYGSMGSGIRGSAAVGLGSRRLLPVQDKKGRKTWKRREDGRVLRLLFFYLSMWWLPTVSKGWTGYLKTGYTCYSASVMAREFLKMNLYFERHI